MPRRGFIWTVHSLLPQKVSGNKTCYSNREEVELPERVYIAIEGAIGVGKTTLARLIRDEFDAELLLEVFEENPFLSHFYTDRERYAFQTQIFFLLSRYRQQQQVVPETLP